jgi:arylsulfatase A-like enzyme
VNVLLVFADQMRGQAMGCAGNEQVHTPNLDRLGREGMLLTRAYANSPVCTPARGTLLTGCYPRRHGAICNDIPIRADLPSIGTVFKRAGYSTGYIGKWHLDGCPRNKFTPPGARRLGFDYWAVHNCTHKYMDSFYYAGAPKRIAIQGYEPVHQTDLALSFIESNRERDFCLVLSWGPPHNPYNLVPDRFKKMYPPEELRLRGNVPEEKDDQARNELSGYYAHVTALDEQMGRILEKLDELNLSDDTLVVFTSDHGDMLHSNARVRKQQPWEESINIPLIFRKPGNVPTGLVCDSLISIVDILPTILGLAEVPIPSSMQGEDLSEMIRGSGAGLEDVLIMEMCPTDEGHRQGVIEWRGLRTERYTYVETFRGPWLLYDNEADPYQLQNLIGETNSAQIQQRLQLRLQARLREVGEEPLPWEQLVRQLDLVELWNIREQELHGQKGRFLT